MAPSWIISNSTLNLSFLCFLSSLTKTTKDNLTWSFGCLYTSMPPYLYTHTMLSARNKCVILQPIRSRQCEPTLLIRILRSERQKIGIQRSHVTWAYGLLKNLLFKFLICLFFKRLFLHLTMRLLL